MKIVDQRGTATRFDDIDVGDYFYEADDTDVQSLFCKIPVVKGEGDAPSNAVYLRSAALRCFTAETRVQAVEIEVTVLSNVQGRPI